MDPEEIEYFRNLKREERKSAVPSLLRNLEERRLGRMRKNVTSKEYRELVAEELLIQKEKYDELHCEMPGMPRSTFLMVFSPDGTMVASTHGNHNIYVTDIRSGKNLKTLVGHPRTPWCIAFHPTSNEIIASGCLGGQVRIWDLSGGSEVWTATNQTVIASIAFHPLERILVVATSNEVYFWDWSKPEPFLHTSTCSHKEKVRYVAFDKLGHSLITGISNCNSRWEYVRSSERSYEPPMRRFNIASRRPVLRRGLFPARRNVASSPSTNVPRESQSRVPERERNITISYRNLVRQYGRLVQRYLQLYRPPAMIDRGTDPMENTVPSTSNETQEVEESNTSNNTADLQEASISNNTADLQAPNSNSSAEWQEPNSFDNSAELQEPSSFNSSAEWQEPNSFDNSSELQEPNSFDNSAELKKPSTNKTTQSQEESCSSNNCSEPQESNSCNTPNLPPSSDQDPALVSIPSDDGAENVQPSEPSTIVSSLAKKHKSDDVSQDHIPRKKFRKSRTDCGGHPASRSKSPQPGTSGLSNQPNAELNCREKIMKLLRSACLAASRHSTNRNQSNTTDINQESQVQPNILETDNRETNVQTEEVAQNITEDSVQNTQQCSISSEDQTENISQNIGVTRELNRQSRNRSVNPYLNTSAIDEAILESRHYPERPTNLGRSSGNQTENINENIAISQEFDMEPGNLHLDPYIDPSRVYESRTFPLRSNSCGRSSGVQTEDITENMRNIHEIRNRTDNSFIANSPVDESLGVLRDYPESSTNLEQSSENLTERSTDNVGNNRESNTQTENLLVNPYTGSVLSINHGQNRNFGGASSYSLPFRRLGRYRQIYNPGTGERYTDVDDNEPSGLNALNHSSLLEVPVPEASEENRGPGGDQRLENMMMNMRRNAEDNLRARFMPVIRSRVPENDREELIRLFEECVRDSRERARLRYRNMGQTVNRQPEQPPIVNDSSDSSSSEDERDSLHMNFYIRSRTDGSLRTTETPSGTGSNTQRSRGSTVPSGNNSYQNINNLESWVTSLFNDADSTSPNTNEMGTDPVQHTRSTSMNINNLLDSPPRMSCQARNRENHNTSMNDTVSRLLESPLSSPPNPAGNTSTGTTNSTSYSLARRRLGNFGRISPTRLHHPRTTQDYRRIRILSSGRWRMSPGNNQHSQGFGIRPVSSPTVINNFPRDEVINFSEFPNSEDDPFLAPERSEPFPSSVSEPFHPFNPPPDLPAINPENIGIGNMYSNIVHDLETSLNNARDTRTVDRPGEMSSILSNFSNRLETLMNQSEGILRNLRTSVEVLPDNDPAEYVEEAPVPTASYNDSTFFVRDQRTDGTNSGRNVSSPLGYDIRQNNATSDHTYPRNSESTASSSNLNESMGPLMNSLHLTLSHIQSQSRLLHRQVECIERIDRAMVEVAQLQLMRLLLVELSTYVRNMSGESRSTSMSSVRQMMAGTRISDSSPGNTQSTRDDDESPIYDPGPSTSSGLRSSNQSSSARSRGLTRKTYPPSRLNRPRDAGRSSRNHQDQPSAASPPPLPSVAPPHTYSEINLFTLIRMDRRLQSLIDDHSTRFSYLNEHLSTNTPRRVFHEVGEHTMALRLRESITRTNRLIGNIFDANVVRNYRIDSSTSLRHGIERYYERTLLSLIIDGISSHLDENRTTPIPPDIRTRMQNVLQLATVMSDLLLLYTINSLAPTTDVNLESERNVLATRISETCTRMIQCRQYRNFSNVFVQSLRSLRLMVSAYSLSGYINVRNRRGYHRGRITRPIVSRTIAQLNDMVVSGESEASRPSDTTDRESNDTAGRESNDTVARESNDTTGRASNDNTTTESNDNAGIGNTRNEELPHSTAPEISSDNSPSNSRLINACLFLARRQREHEESINRDPLTRSLREMLREQSLATTPLSMDFLRRRRQVTRSQYSALSALLNENNSYVRNRRRNSTDVTINAYLTAGRNRTQNRSESTQDPETENVNRSLSPDEISSARRLHRDLAWISSFRNFRPTQNTTGPGQNQSQGPSCSSSRNTERTHIFSSLPSMRNEHINNALRNVNSDSEDNGPSEGNQSAGPQAVSSNMDINAWWENAVEQLTSEPPEDNHRNLLFGTSSYESRNFPPLIPPLRTRPSSTNNAPEVPESPRHWRIPSVQVNDVPVELGPSHDSSESDNSPTPAPQNNNSSSYPRVMARLAAIRSVSVYNPIGVLRPRLLHPLYATLNPFDADLEQREHIYDSDVISTVTPNHRIQVWDISDSNIPDISDPLKNLVVRECKIHNDASVDIASDGSILVTLLPSGGYLNITNRLGVYSLRWETLGQCLYTTSFVHNAVSVSLSPLGRHLVVGLASRRVSLLPNDRWMMASIFKIEEKDTPGDHLPFVRQIDRDTDERATNHKSVNCIRWLPTSGQGLIYATNTGQLNIWT